MQWLRELLGCSGRRVAEGEKEREEAVDANLESSTLGELVEDEHDWMIKESRTLLR